MNHRQAINNMLEFVDGRLDERTEAALATHARSCPGCRGWAETHRLLAECLAPAAEKEAPEAHPPSELLALCAVRPEEICESNREELREHLEACRFCREAVALLTEAIRDAKPTTFFGYPASVPRSDSTRQSWKGMAVGFVLLVIALGLKILLGAPLLGPSPGDYADQGDRSGTATAGDMDLRIVELTDRGLEGRHVIRGERSLAVSNIVVNSGADVTFQADEVVSFGDGFQVASGARITVGIGPEDARSSGIERSGEVREDGI